MNPSNLPQHDMPHRLLWPNWWQHHDQRDATPSMWRSLLAFLGIRKSE